MTAPHPAKSTMRRWICLLWGVDFWLTAEVLRIAYWLPLPHPHNDPILEGVTVGLLLGMYLLIHLWLLNHRAGLIRFLPAVLFVLPWFAWIEVGCFLLGMNHAVIVVMFVFGADLELKRAAEDRSAEPPVNYRFNLRSLFVATTFIAALLGLRPIFVILAETTPMVPLLLFFLWSSLVVAFPWCLLRPHLFPQALIPLVIMSCAFGLQFFCIPPPYHGFRGDLLTAVTFCWFVGLNLLAFRSLGYRLVWSQFSHPSLLRPRKFPDQLPNERRT